jgi:hypothetical protein
MALKRRELLGALGAFALDPERLLWRRGARMISIPKPAPKLPEIWLVFDRYSIGRIVYREDDRDVILANCPIGGSLCFSGGIELRPEPNRSILLGIDLFQPGIT